jgi:hypothetical protein
MAFSRVLTLEEAIQTFDEKEDSCMFSLKIKPPANIDSLAQEQQEKSLNGKIIRLRKQTIEVDGV